MATPLITAPIPPQAFELVRDRIGEIIETELANQVTSFYDPGLDTSVYVEASVPFDRTELSLVNINYAGGPVESKNAKDSTSAYVFNIDVFGHAKSTELINGDKSAAIKVQRIIGACRSIMQNPVYKTLAFLPGVFISRVSLREIGIMDPGSLKQDAMSTYMGRLVIIVQCIEIESLIIPPSIAGYDTRLKISEGDQGYKYTGNE